MEILFYGGAVYGFGFMQYIFEKEEVFWDELCYTSEKYPNCTQSMEEVHCPFEKEPCADSSCGWHDRSGSYFSYNISIYELSLGLCKLEMGI